MTLVFTGIGIVSCIAIAVRFAARIAAREPLASRVK